MTTATKPTLTKEQVIDGINQYIANHQGTPVIEAIKATVQANGTSTIIKVFELSSISAFYLQLVDKFPQCKDDLRAMARKTNPYFVNDTARFLEHLKATAADSCYKCNVFMQDGKNGIAEQIKFPNGTLSYIGARTHRGKTTAMVSIAADAYHQGKNVFFYTNEESADMIIARLVKIQLFFNMCPDYDGSNECTKDVFALVGDADLTDEINNALLPDASGKTSHTPLHKEIQKAFLDVTTAMHNGKLNIIDGLAQRTFDDIIDTLSLLNAGDVVLMDYIQHIRRPAAATAQLQLQKASQDIADIAAKQDLIIIAGAQLNRDASTRDDGDDGYDDKPGKPDKFGEQYYRESGDIEQDAHIAIQIGQQLHPDTNEPPTRFYKVLKQRNHTPDDHRYLIDDNARFSLFSCKTDKGMMQYFKPQKPEPKKNDRTPAAKGKQPASSWNATNDNGKDMMPEEFL